MGGNEFDALIVGAGPAGATAALVLARRGCKVAVIERGEFPGAKNMFGGTLFGSVLNDIIPGFWKKAPVERFVGRRVISLLAEDSAVSLDFSPAAFKKAPYNGFTVQRARFDRWYAGEAVKAGALLINRTVVDDIIWENGRVAGVKVRRPGGEIRAKVVIAADGALSLLARKAGLRGEPAPGQFSLGVKEVLQLPPEVLEERFGLGGDEGVSCEFLGLMGGLPGGAFLYTNRESLSVGVVVRVSLLKEKGKSIYGALEQFKRHPAVAPLLEGGRFLEYSAHLIPEAGPQMLSRLYTGGMLVAGDAAGLVLSGGVFLEGVNLAVASGRLAAETALQALEKGKFDAPAMAGYQAAMEESFVLKDLQRYKRASAMLLNERLYQFYPSFACRVLENWLKVDGTGHPKLAGVIRSVLGGGTGLRQAAKDAWQIGRALVW
ncbi:MAG: FAD-dependent oxidoreductase [Pelotomaculum sp.]|nr:FAD-dependent oxidoreductase [Pelotomaculum sp.]